MVLFEKIKFITMLIQQTIIACALHMKLNLHKTEVFKVTGIYLDIKENIF